MSYGLLPCSDRLNPSQPQQIQSRYAECRHRTGAFSAMTMSVLIQLGVTDPMLAVDAPAVSHQLQQGFWGGAQTGEEEMGLPDSLAVTSADGVLFHYPAGAASGLMNVLKCRFGTERPGFWAIVQSQIAVQSAATSTCKKK